jgi:transposase
LERQITRRVTPIAPSLLALRGCGALTAAKLVGETADVRRFTSRAAFAMFNGTAPVPVWSGSTTRHRLNRGGNRQVNAALHRILVTQMRHPGPACDYLQRRMTHGNTKTEAIRALRRHLSDAVYRRLLEDSTAQPGATGLEQAA